MKSLAVRYDGINPETYARKIEVIEFKDGLEFLQEQVQGYIEHVFIDEKLRANHIDMWINEEGKLTDKFSPSFALTYQGELYDVILGPCLFTKFDDSGETYGLDSDEVLEVIGYLNELNVVGISKATGEMYPCLLVKAEV